MSGSSIPYHLRHNKAIDRNLFVDLLSRVGRFRNISAYRYIGFGGPFLEDFKTLHAALRISKMISIEADENVSLRQKFNLPLSCMELRNDNSGEFIADFDFYEDCIVWLDFTDPSKIGEQLAELEVLINKLQSGSVFKITLNAAASSLGVAPSGRDLQEFRAEKAAGLLGAYGPAVISSADVTSKNYPSLLLGAVEAAAKRGVSGRRGYVTTPLSCFTYADGQAMLAVTGVVLRKAEEDNFFAQTRLHQWEFTATSWLDLKEINVPSMSVKERMLVESMLPNAEVEDIERELGYHIGESSSESSRMISNFSKYYRMYPWYSRVSI